MLSLALPTRNAGQQSGQKQPPGMQRLAELAISPTYVVQA